MRIAIFGTGGAGGLFGALLIRAGHEVSFIARGEHLRAMQETGLIVETPNGVVKIPAGRATNDPAQIGCVDLVLVGVKAWQVAEAAKAMRPLIGPDSVVIPLQNGVEAASELAHVIGPAPILMGLCGTFSWVVEPGRIRNISASNFIRFGETDNSRSERTRRLLDIFSRTGFEAEIPADIHRALWMKFLLVTSLGGIGAISRAPIGVLRECPNTRRLLERCVQETFYLSSLLGVDLDKTAIADTMATIDKLEPGGTTSLQRDITECKPSELDYWSGAIVRLAKGVGLAVPTHELIYDLLLPLDRRARGSLVFPE